MDLFELEDDQTAKELQTKFKKARSAHRDWREQAEEDFNFVAGNQWDDADISKLNAEGRPIITFNRCNAVLSAVLGLEANQRQQVKYSPREAGDTKLSDAVDQAIDWVRDYGSMEIEEAQVFEHMLTCGMGWTETRMDYDTDYDGKVVQEVISPFEMEWDESSRKRNLEDARWVCRAKRMSAEEIKESWPEATKTIAPESFYNESSTKTGFSDESEDKYAFPGEKSESKSDDPLVYHFNWYENEEVYRVANPMTGEIKVATVDEYKELRNIVPTIPAVKQRRRVYYEAFCLGSELLEKRKAPCQSNFRFKCVTGKKDEIYNSWYGIVRFMKDPQRWANKFFSTFIDILDSNAKGGLIVEENSVSDIRKFEENWAKADSVLWVRQGSIQHGRIMNKPVAPYPQTVDKLLQFAIQSIYDVTGVNLEMLGMADRAQPGIVEESRKRSAYTILAMFFDNMRMYRKSSGLLLLDYVKNYVPEQRLAAVLEPELVPYIPQIKSLDLTQVNVIVSESPQSDNNKMIVWQFISQIVPALIKMGIPVPPEILEYSPLPGTLVEKWKNLIDPDKAAGIPPEQQVMVLKQQMQQMGQMLEQFKMENDKLKTQEAVKMAELESKKNLSAAELVLEREKLQADFALKQEELNKKMEIELLKLRSDREIEIAKADADITLKKETNMMAKDALQEVEVAKSETAKGLVQAMDRMHGANGDLQNMHNGLLMAMQMLARQMSAPKRVVRDANGKISGVEIEIKQDD